MAKILDQKFFNRPTIKVARGLLGKLLVRQTGKKKTSAMITEVEAYDGPKDLASHASRGRFTPRTKVMFGEAGYFYVYFTYGMHWLLNVVTGPKGYPSAVLIRGAVAKNGRKTINLNGPARLTRYLKIGKNFNGKLSGRRTGLWLEERRVKVRPSQITAGKRIGVDYAGSWAEKLYNFRLGPE